MVIWGCYNWWPLCYSMVLHLNINMVCCYYFVRSWSSFFSFIAKLLRTVSTLLTIKPETLIQTHLTLHHAFNYFFMHFVGELHIMQEIEISGDY
jgi:hypothetical protein